MRVVDADEMGFCFGVRDALARARSEPEPGGITIHGELVHNEAVLAELAARGYASSPESARGIPPTARVLITAHGISDRERARLLAAGKQLVDTTCPLVQRVHETAQRLLRDGRFVVVLGKPGHVEVRGIMEDLGRAAVVATAADVCTWPETRIGIVCQTTLPAWQARDLERTVRSANPGADVVFVDTICEPTRRRIAAVERLAPCVDMLVVVGGRHSNNTLQLVHLGRSLGLRTLHVQGAADVQPDQFADCATVGLTAGTSTLDQTIAEVRAAIAVLPATRSGS